MAFISQFVNVLLITLIDLQILKNPCIPGMLEESLHPWDAHLVMVYDLFNVLLDSDC